MQKTITISITAESSSVWAIQVLTDDNPNDLNLVYPNSGSQTNARIGTNLMKVDIHDTSAGAEFEIKVDGKSIGKGKTGADGGYVALWRFEVKND